MEGHCYWSWINFHLKRSYLYLIHFYPWHIRIHILNSFIYRLVYKEIKESTDVCPLLLGMFQKRPITLCHSLTACTIRSAEFQLLTCLTLLQHLSGCFSENLPQSSVLDTFTTRVFGGFRPCQENPFSKHGLEKIPRDTIHCRFSQGSTSMG